MFQFFFETNSCHDQRLGIQDHIQNSNIHRSLVRVFAEEAADLLGVLFFVLLVTLQWSLIFRHLRLHSAAENSSTLAVSISDGTMEM